jgi:hypothetical protein
MSFPEEIDVELRPKSLSVGISWRSYRKLNGRTYELAFGLDVAMLAKEPDGWFTCNAEMQISGSVVCTREVMFTGQLMPWITVYPDAVFLRDVHPGETVERTLRVCPSIDNDELEVHTENPDIVRARLIAGDLSVSVHVPEEPGVFATSLQLSAGAQSHRIPVVGIVERD